MEEPPPSPPPPPPQLRILPKCIISSSQEDLLDRKGFAFSDNSYIQIDQEFEQPSLPLDENPGIKICSLEDSSSSSSSSDEDEDLEGAGKPIQESPNQKNLGLSHCDHDDSTGGEDRAKVDKENTKGVNDGSAEHCGVEGGEKRIRLVGDCSTGGDRKEECGDKKDECGDKKKELEVVVEEEDIMSIAIKAGLEMPRPRWWRRGGYETR